MRIKSIIFSFLLFIVLFSAMNSVDAYGWGYKKNALQEIPDVGKYGAIIDEQLAFYADKQTDKNIYLTFDNGYEAGYTDGILEVLKNEKVPATFFVTGHYVEEEPALVKRMDQDGHIIGNHSYHHPDFTTMKKAEIKQELELVEEAVKEITGKIDMKYVRPPRGTFNEQTLKWTEELGYVTTFWSLAFKDWETDKQKGWQYAYDNIMEQIHPGAIILLHTVSEDNAEALGKVIQKLKQDGYVFKSLDDLLWKNMMPQDILF